MYSNSEYNNNLNQYSQDIIDLFYPIGRGFIDFTDTDYSNYLGCTWERELVGLTPIGYNPNDSDFNQIGKTLGEKTHQLTKAELPNFGGNLNFHGSGGQATVLQNVTGDFAGANMKNQYIGGSPISGAGSTGIAVLNVGNNQPHNNIQPSKVVAYWKRVA